MTVGPLELNTFLHQVSVSVLIVVFCAVFFVQALDCFSAVLSRSESRLQMAETIGSKLNISKEQVPEHM